MTGLSQQQAAPSQAVHRVCLLGLCLGRAVLGRMGLVGRLEADEAHSLPGCRLRSVATARGKLGKRRARRHDTGYSTAWLEENQRPAMGKGGARVAPLKWGSAGHSERAWPALHT